MSMDGPAGGSGYVAVAMDGESDALKFTRIYGNYLRVSVYPVKLNSC